MTEKRHITYVALIAVLTFVLGAGAGLYLNGSFNLWYVLLGSFIITGFCYRELSKKIVKKKEPVIKDDSVNNPDVFDEAIKKYTSKH
jgi:hypothetical protein